MLKDVFDAAVEELEKRRTLAKGNIYFEEEVEQEGKNLLETYDAIRNWKPLPRVAISDISGLLRYRCLVYDMLSNQYSELHFNELKKQAEGICKLFGPIRVFYMEEFDNLNQSERDTWIKEEHMNSLIQAYNLSMLGIELATFLETAERIKKILKEEEGK